MSALKIKKLLQLPETFEPNTMYLIPSSTVPGKYDSYVSDADGTGVLQSGGSAEEPIEPFLLMGV